MARRTLRSAGQSALRLPPLLNRLIEAEARDRQRESATVLRTYGELALVTIPTRGVFAPADQEDLYRAIENASQATNRQAQHKTCLTAASISITMQ